MKHKIMKRGIVIILVFSMVFSYKLHIISYANSLNIVVINRLVDVYLPGEGTDIVTISFDTLLTYFDTYNTEYDIITTTYEIYQNQFQSYVQSDSEYQSQITDHLDSAALARDVGNETLENYYYELVESLKYAKANNNYNKNIVSFYVTNREERIAHEKTVAKSNFSSMVIDLVYYEYQREYLESLLEYRNMLVQVDKVKYDKDKILESELLLTKANRDQVIADLAILESNFELLNKKIRNQTGLEFGKNITIQFDLTPAFVMIGQGFKQLSDNFDNVDFELKRIASETSAKQSLQQELAALFGPNDSRTQTIMFEVQTLNLEADKLINALKWKKDLELKSFNDQKLVFSAKLSYAESYAAFSLEKAALYEVGLLSKLDLVKIDVDKTYQLTQFYLETINLTKVFYALGYF